ncbi:MAG: cytochrome c biogenesis protein CcdA [Phycisphaerales bacterium]
MTNVALPLAKDAPSTRVLSLLLSLLAVIAGLWLPARAEAQPQVVDVTASPMRSTVAPGDTLAIAVVLDHQKGWHTNPHEPIVPKAWQGLFDPIPTTVVVKAPAGVVLRTTQFPATHTVSIDLVGNGKREAYAVFEGKAVAYVPVEIAKDASGELVIPITVDYQACNDKVCMPSETVELSVKLKVDPAATKSVDDASLFAGFDAKAFEKPGEVLSSNARSTSGDVPKATAQTPASTDAVFDLFGLRFSSGNTLVVLLFSALGGFILNLMPCVLPLIPIKIFAIQQAAGEHAGRRIQLGVAMFLGVVSFWAALAVLIVSLKFFSATNELFGNATFQLCVGLFIIAMAVGMMGMFTLNLPQGLYAIQPRHDTLHGSFLFGVMTALLGTPCFGPFAASGVSWATQQSSGLAFSVFFAVGVGMALPYLVLTIWPKLISFIPRSGPVSDLIKQVLSLIMASFGVYFTGVAVKTFIAESPYLGKTIEWWFVFAIALGTSLWLIVRAFKITKGAGPRLAALIVAFGLAGSSYWWAARLTEIARMQAEDNLWREYEPAAYGKALAEGKVVIADFTATWCLNCQTLKGTVLGTKVVRDALKQPGVVAFEVDLSSKKAPGWALLKELNEPGIPLLAIRGPGYATPWKSNAYNPTQVVEAIAAARGTASQSASSVQSPR